MKVVQTIKNYWQKLDLKSAFDFKTPKLQSYQAAYLNGMKNILDNFPDNIEKTDTLNGPVFTVYSQPSSEPMLVRLNHEYYRVGPNYVAYKGRDVTDNGTETFVSEAYAEANQRYLRKYQPQAIRS